LPVVHQKPARELPTNFAKILDVCLTDDRQTDRQIDRQTDR